MSDFTFAAPVLGIRTSIATNDRAVAHVARESFDAWNALDSSLIDAGYVEVRIEVDDAALAGGAATRPPAVPAAGGDAAVWYERAGATTLLFHGTACEGVADAARGEALLRVTSALVRSTEQFRYTVLEAAVLFLVTSPNRFPVHASAVMKGGRALLLAGASGVGKSTLAWTAYRAGWDLLSDDIVYVQGEPVWRLWGGGGTRSYFAEGAERLLPELRAVEPQLRAGLERKRVLTRPLPMPPVATHASLCVLERGAAPAAEPLDGARAVESLLAAAEPGFDVFGEAARERLAPLAAHAMRLTVGPNPALVLPILERLVRV